MGKAARRLRSQARSLPPRGRAAARTRRPETAPAAPPVRASAAAADVVSGAGYLVARRLSEVPENTMKLAVGVMLTSFGVFWVGEGSGLHWPGSDLMILVLVGVFAATALVLSLAMRRIGPSPSAEPDAVGSR